MLYFIAVYAAYDILAYLSWYFFCIINPLFRQLNIKYVSNENENFYFLFKTCQCI